MAGSDVLIKTVVVSTGQVANNLQAAVPSVTGEKPAGKRREQGDFVCTYWPNGKECWWPAMVCLSPKGEKPSRGGSMHVRFFW
uniref:PWWP domain-containing protein n=1 Tax=Macrostomum lignano TaxID=282301 RepID=A0A1I8ISG8_9PLAT